MEAFRARALALSLLLPFAPWAVPSSSQRMVRFSFCGSWRVSSHRAPPGDSSTVGHQQLPVENTWNNARWPACPGRPKARGWHYGAMGRLKWRIRVHTGVEVTGGDPNSGASRAAVLCFCLSLVVSPQVPAVLGQA